MTRLQMQECAEGRLAALLRYPLVLKLAQVEGLPKDLTANVELVTRPRMIALNGQFRGKKRPTDVLSFSAPEVFRGRGALGDLVLCASVVRTQAREQDHSIECELDVLLVHGILHLLGYDHERSGADAKKMARLENRILSDFGKKGNKSVNPLPGLVDRT